jgi:hypothetical protein
MFAIKPLTYPSLKAESVQAFHCSPFSLRYLSATQNMSLAVAEKGVACDVIPKYLM